MTTASSQNLVKLTTLDELANRLDVQSRQVEAGLRTRWNRTRREQGRILRDYQNLYKPLRLWTKFLAAVGLAEKTAYRLMEDADATVSLPAPIIDKAEQRGIDLSQRKFRFLVDRIKQIVEGGDEISEEKAEKILNQVLKSRRNRVEGDKLTRPNPSVIEEKKRFKIRIGIRKALIGIEPNQKIQILVPALEEEMHDVWRLTEPVTITLTPRPSKSTPWGRRKDAEAA